MSDQLSYAGRAPHIEMIDGQTLGFNSKEDAEKYRAFRHGLMVGMTLGHSCQADRVSNMYRMGTLPTTPEALTRLDWDLRREQVGTGNPASEGTSGSTRSEAPK